VAIWSRAIPLVKDFPVWGTGYSSYQYVDVLHRSDAYEADIIVDHAHNDYLEALVEGGLVLFIPVVVAVVLIFRLGFRAVHRNENRPAGALALGALVAFTTVAIHSFSDFGMHIPANAVIVTVVCAHLCAAGEREWGGPTTTAREEADGSDRIVLRLRGLAPVLGAVAAAALGLGVAADGWRAHRAQEFRLRGFELDADPEPAIREGKVAALEAAVRLLPGYARMQAELAQAHLTILERRREELAERRTAAAAGGPGAITVQDSAGEIEAERQFTQLHLGAALLHFLRSRDVCPLRAEAHMAIAEYVDKFEKAEPREAYLERAKSLCPDDPDLWKRCGSFELADGLPDQAWASWRRSLELSHTYLPEILSQSAQRLSPDEILHRVLPEQPAALLKAALQLYPEPGAGRRPFLEKALGILDQRPDGPGGEDVHEKAAIHRALGRPVEAVAAYRAALEREPLRISWRYELAELLYEQGQFSDSFQELLKVQLMQPDNEQARALMDAVKGKIAQGK
jgi:tetratricopeptide (TPR) repeat protein